MSDPTDPRTTQKRIAVTPSGRQVWVDITGDDRLRIIKRLPSRWPEVLMARERGQTLEEISRWAKVMPACPDPPGCQFTKESMVAGVLIPGGEHIGPECLAYLISACYADIETRLNDLAQHRARLMV